MRLSALLFLLAFDVSARTVTIEGGITLVVCDDFKIVHYADQAIVLSCPTTKFRLKITDCAKPKLQVLSPGNFSLTC